MAWQDNYSAEEVARIIEETEGAALNEGFNADAHVAAVWGQNDSSTVSGDATAPETPVDSASTEVSSSQVSNNSNAAIIETALPEAEGSESPSDISNSNSSSWSSEVREMSPQERDYYYAQVGDAMYQ